jgi:hypothetical protein
MTAWLSGGVLVALPAVERAAVPKGLVTRLELLAILDPLNYPAQEARGNLSYYRKND